MKTMKLLLLAILFTVSLHAQNDTAYFDDGSMVIGKGGIKVSIEDGNIVIDGSGITDFVPVDTITRLMPGVCDNPDEELSDNFEWTSATTKLHEVPHPMHINNPKNGDVKTIPPYEPYNEILPKRKHQDGEEPGMYVFYDKIWYKIPE